MLTLMIVMTDETENMGKTALMVLVVETGKTVMTDGADGVGGKW